MVFDDYARYYDLFYRDKDYRAEAEYLVDLFEMHGKEVSSILDLGCGTGRHDRRLSRRGFEVTGVDMSEEMLSAARGSCEAEDAGGRAPAFVCSDIRTLRLDRTFDAVISLFHVMSYLSSNADLVDAMTTARVHLSPGGVFVFDFWYGAGVLADPPTRRVRNYRDGGLEVTRTSEPLVHHNRNLVDVNYRLEVRDGDGTVTEEINETHRMRYLFAPELEMMLGQAGFDVLGIYGFMTTEEPGPGSWNACMVAEARP